MAPVTFLRRVLCGRDPLQKQFFFDKWGSPCRAVRNVLRGQKILWISAQSGGEAVQCNTFLKLLRKKLPEYGFLVSSECPEVFEFMNKHALADGYFFTPWDIGWVTRRALRCLRPQAVVFIENCSYPVLVQECSRAGVRTALASGCMRRGYEKHPFNNRMVPHAGFSRLELIIAKGEFDRRRFLELGARAEQIVIGGDMKYDKRFLAVAEDEKAALFAQVGFDPGRPVFICGSILDGEVVPVVRACEALERRVPAVQILIAPRHPQASIHALEQELSKQSLPHIRRSRVDERNKARIVLLDTFGELPKLYRLATVVFVGGTLVLNPQSRMGYGQSIIEPLLHGKPVVVGPYCRKSEEEVASLKEIFPEVVVHDAASLAESAERIIADSVLRGKLCNKTDELTRDYGNASGRTAEMVAELLHA